MRRSANTDSTRNKAITAKERAELIATTAYYRAERRGFALGQELEDWIEAEAETDRLTGCHKTFAAAPRTYAKNAGGDDKPRGGRGQRK